MMKHAKRGSQSRFLYGVDCYIILFQAPTATLNVGDNIETETETEN